MNGNFLRTFKNEHSFSNMCRICLAWNGDCMPSIFDSLKSDNSIPIIEVINNLTSISIKEGDGLPERICDGCLTAIERIIEFKQLCEQTDSNLRNFLLSLNGKNGCKTTNDEGDKENVQTKQVENDVYSSISERICVESEVVVVDPSSSVYDENQNQSVVYYNHPTASSGRTEQEWSNEPAATGSGGHSVFDWEAGDNASEFVQSSYDTVESFTYDKLASSGHGSGYLPRAASVHGSDDDDVIPLETFTCRICNKEFHTQKWLERHEQLHDDTQPYPCDYCFRSYATMAELSEHWRDHAEGRDFCRLCGEPFADKSLQRQHVARHFAASQQQVAPAKARLPAATDSCEQCLTGFGNVADMQLHMIKCHPGRNVAASAPPDPSSADSSEHRCRICQKTFGRRSNLMKHMLALHSGFRPHRCSTCKNAFASKADLARHTSTHTGERPYSCHVCLYSFSRRDKLVRHMRTHSSERPYSCELCATRFKWSDKLLRHMRSAHPEHESVLALTQLQLYKCKQCTDSFKTRLELARHSMQAHAASEQPVVALNRMEHSSESATVRNES
ncbi:zinc finger protein 436 [Nilaparvata lugens]|uniref:zinc finger protein 436 n=1 Tax=Nilaparvata lugens TaxID=108931 RepID=UPI000B99C6D9|nr:zinc finger protein 436 [Nilaparvata lugens]XP_022194066.1 zinc finger protein 436 [Nilaparvata lugens]